MKLIKVAAAALNQTPLDWRGNARNIIETLDAARGAGVSILCLPELCISGYGCEDAFLSPHTQRQALRVLHEELVPRTEGLVACFGLPLFVSGGVFNGCALVADGKIIGFAAKQKLAGDGIHYEPRWFKPWPDGALIDVPADGERGPSVPLGDQVFDCGGVRLGFEICEDAWVAERPGASLAGRGVDVIMNPSASHFAFDKHHVRERLVLEGSRAFGVTYLYANLLGNEAGRTVYDGDTLVASAGKILARGKRFSYAPWELIVATVDIDVTRTQRAWLSSYRPAIGAPPATSVPMTYPPSVPEPTAPEPEPWELVPPQKEEQFSRAVALALFDYMRKSWSRGFVVSLSGGADSAACACLVALMVRFGCSQLGVQGFRERLPYLDAVSSAETESELVRALLTTVYQPTRNSSDVTRDAARAIAEGIGANHSVLSVDELVESYTARVAETLGRPLTWETDDIALQNIQARVRSPSVWMLANVLGSLLLSTSNRSEAAVGYATMDGDTSGGLSPIAGIDKAFLRSWLRWLETVGPDGLEPMPALHAVNAQQPTAELRPLEKKQTDEDDLMPYEVLDAIERAAIRDKRSPNDCYRVLRVQYPQVPARRLGDWVERFFKLWSRNQWKRERYAPSFHVDDENLDPKTWCRFPILSGGFRQELEELRDLVEEDARGEEGSA